ncbi:MAG: transposase [Anaeroplasma bactoclasticum]|nr:transposase [Anaeroplasma bactoclasticum]
MRIIQGQLREEMQMITLETMIEEDNPVRTIDALIESMGIGEEEKPRKSEAGRPKYGTKTMLKLHILGNRLGIRSGQKLENLCKYDVRAKWLLEGQTPDKNTINDFRKNNLDLLKKVFYEANRIYIAIGMLKIEDVSEDGFKMKANNSKERNYTITKIIDRIKKEIKEIEKKEEYKKALEEAENKAKEYLECLEREEELERIKEEIKEAKKEKERIIKEKEELDNEIEEVKARKEKHEGMLETMKKEGVSQVSLTDEESRLMPNNGKFEVCYNNQTAVDMKTHMTVAITTDNNPADVGSMSGLMEKMKEEYKEEIEGVVTNTTDKGYHSIEDMMECLEMGVIPQVTPNEKGKKEIELTTKYEEVEITEKEKKSVKKEDIKKCLRAGVIPECYEGKISKIEIVEEKESQREEGEEKETRSSEEIRETAIQNQTFERDLNSGLVYCPMGEILGKKSTRKQGAKRYCNKEACKRCKNPCTKCGFKEVEFKEGQKTLVPKNSTAVKPRRKQQKKVMTKKVKVTLLLEEELLKKRMQTSEHSQGTMKTANHFVSFSMQGREKAEAELALYFTASNARRAENIKKVPELVKLLKEYQESRLNGTQIGQKQLQVTENIPNFGFFLCRGGCYLLT